MLSPLSSSTLNLVFLSTLVVLSFSNSIYYNVVSATGGVNSTYFVNRTSVCMASLQEPRKPRALEFCYWQNEQACCTPANDAAAKESFQSFTDLGPGCAPTDHKIRAAYREVHQFACLPCHPMEPKFRVDKRTGDMHLSGGQVPPDASASEGDFIWRVCYSFVFGKDESTGTGGLWGKNGTKFDACGIRPQGGNGVHGDDVDFTIPSVAYNDDNRTVIAENFVSVLPNFLPGFNAYIVDDRRADFNYNITPCFGSAGGLSRVMVFIAAIFVACAMMML